MKAEFKVRFMCNSMDSYSKHVLYLAQEESIKEMTSQLARVDALTREGKTTTLHILTREAADEERRDLERELERLKVTLKEKDRVISDRDALIQNRDHESVYFCPTFFFVVDS